MKTLSKVDQLKIQGKTIYVSGVNMAYSFDSLIRIAKENEIDINKGDVLICDNKNGDKRKVIKKVENGFVIMYARRETKQSYAQIKKTAKKLNFVDYVLSK